MTEEGGQDGASSAPEEKVLDVIISTIQRTRERQASGDEFELVCHPSTNWMAILGQRLGIPTRRNDQNWPLSIGGVPVRESSSVEQGFVMLNNLSALKRFRTTGIPEPDMAVRIKLHK
jgi:hypothetical protein